MAQVRAQVPAPARGQAARVRRLAREQFGYARLRSGQEESILAALAGHDTLAVMPTGSGKSAICQIAATLVDGRPRRSRRTDASSRARGSR